MKPIGNIRYITIHASYTPPSLDIGEETIRGWHVDERGWLDTGYHRVIRRDGTVENGRPIRYQGAHVGGFNAGNIGICMVGGKKEGVDEPEDNFTNPQWVTLFMMMRSLLNRHPHAIIMGHNGFAGHEARGCPCFDWRAWREDFFKRIHAEQVQLPSHWYDEVDKE